MTVDEALDALVQCKLLEQSIEILKTKASNVILDENMKHAAKISPFLHLVDDD